MLDRADRVLLLILLASAQKVFAQNGALDPVFGLVPFSQWMAQGDQAPIPWKVRVSAGELSSHQRLQADFEIKVDGNELVRRRGKGQLVMLVQLTDSAGRIYQSHGALKLADVKDETAKADVIYNEYAFVLPGDYKVALALYDSSTGEHSTSQRMLHVAPLRNDPLAGAWRDVPPVELLTAQEAPDNLFLPSLTGRLRLPLVTARALQLQLLVNMARSEAEVSHAGAIHALNLSNLLAATKVLSQIDVENGKLNIGVLDLARRRFTFEQEAVRDLDWPKFKASLAQADPNTIDARSLGAHQQNAQFLLDEISRRISGTGPAPDRSLEPLRVVILLSAPMAFSAREAVHPVEVAKCPNCRVFYIRYHALIAPPARPAYLDLPARGRRPPPSQPAAEEQMDSLDHVLKPFEPHLFDVYTPQQFRKALATLLDEIARM